MDSCIVLVSTLADAKKFLKENPTESKVVAARIFNVPVKRLVKSISRNSGDIRGGQNKILEPHQERAIHGFIRSLLLHGLQPTRELVFNAIVSLKRLQSSKDSGSTKRWFRNWWQRSGLHQIKTKSLAAIRFEAADESDVRKWFDDYKKALKTLNIRSRRNIVNFDEAGFRVGCMKGQEIIVSLNINEHYHVSSENRKSIIIIEMINAADEYPPSPMIIIQKFEIMASWFSEDLPAKTRIVPSESGFTSDKIAVEFLKHYIEHSDASPNAE
jgi:hypothetical protein